LKEGSRLLGLCTNNEAEYNAVLDGLKQASELGEKDVVVVSDSALVVNQLNNAWQVKNQRMKKLKEAVDEIAKGFVSVRYIHVPRENPWISRADALCNRALDKANGKQTSPLLGRGGG